MKKKLPALAAILLLALYFLFFRPVDTTPADVPAGTTIENNTTDTDQTDTGKTDTGSTDIGSTDTGNTDISSTGTDNQDPQSEETALPEDGTYTSRDEVALYLHLYGHLPSNYITKKEAKSLGWKSSGTLDEVAPGMSIGGDRFGNREGLLPEGHTWYECDIDYVKGSRNSKRILYSDDGLIYYTDDHYNTFTQLYGEE